MAYKPAKTTFTKDEVTEILRQNLALFKDEPDFIEYFINLALYLIDQSYCSTGARSTGLDTVLATYTKLKNESAAGLGSNRLEELLAFERSKDDLPPPKRPHEIRKAQAPRAGQKSSAMRSTATPPERKFEPVFKSPPPLPTDPDEHDEYELTTAKMKFLDDEAEKIAELARLGGLFDDPKTESQQKPDDEEISADFDSAEEEAPPRPLLKRFQSPADESQHPFGPARSNPFRDRQ